MRIVIISDTFSERMGYGENFLPEALAALGHEVHVLASNAQPYHDHPFYKEVYEPFLGPPIQACEVKLLDGYTLHRLPFQNTRFGKRIRGLGPTLQRLKPDVVQALDSSAPSTWEVAVLKQSLGFKLFLESHVHASVFPPATSPQRLRTRIRWRAYVSTVGRFVGEQTELCYPISTDAADIATRFYGIPASKVRVTSLGVNVRLFFPVHDTQSANARDALRTKLGFKPKDIVCVYSGRFTPAKGPEVLARAIAAMVKQGLHYRALFVGAGGRAEVEALRSQPGCVVHPFVPVQELAPLYRASDLGVWPRQESLSQLDAVACGLPIVISNRVTTLERIEGNGASYVEGDADDLARVLAGFSSGDKRRKMGAHGAAKITAHYSWAAIAGERVCDYQRALDSASVE